MSASPLCPVCQSSSTLYDVVDFNKSCEEPRGKYLPVLGAPIYYAICDQCELLFAADMIGWSDEQYRALVYNDDYVQIDPDYVSKRPLANADYLQGAFQSVRGQIRHLDYGGGNGALSEALRAQGWDSTSFDPFYDDRAAQPSLGRFNMITAFEVFEHVPDPKVLIADLQGLLADDGIVLFSTLVSDGQIRRPGRLTWWYASPRNGHICIYSTRALKSLAAQGGFKVQTFNPSTHMYYRTLPAYCIGILT